MGVDPISLAIIGTAVAAGGEIYQGISEAQAAEEQANIVGKQASESARERKRQIQRLASKQKVSFLKSGVSLEGTPIDILSETFNIGQQDINAILETGRSQQRALIKGGRDALIGGFTKAIGTGLTGFQQFGGGFGGSTSASSVPVGTSRFGTTTTGQRVPVPSRKPTF